MVAAHGGDLRQVEDLSRLPQAKLRYSLLARDSGYVAAVQADKVAWAALALGAGRATKDDVIDHAVGIEVHAKVGDAVAAGDLLMTVHANDDGRLQAALGFVGGRRRVQRGAGPALAAVSWRGRWQLVT